VETKNNDATTRAQKTRRGNEMRCAAVPRSGLFDIVKMTTGGRPVLLSASGFRQHAQRQEMPPDALDVLDETRVTAGVRAARPRQIVGHDIGDAAGS
jgi:hypothetical protein